MSTSLGRTTTLPDTPVGRQVAWMIERIAAGGEVDLPDIEQHLLLGGLNSAEIQIVFKRLATRGLRLVELTSDPSLRFVLRGMLLIGEDRVRLSAEVEREGPHRLIALRFRRFQRFEEILARTPAAGAIADVVTEHIEPWAARMSAGGVVVGAVREQEECVVSFGDVSEDRLFELGSVTKPFTATLLAEMLERSEVRLDDTVASFLPTDVVNPRDAEGGEITLLSLATHSAALPRAAPDWAPADPHNPYADFTVDKLYEALGRTTLDAPIGSNVTYSNYGYALLGHVLALAAARPYEELVVERVCRPLGLDETAVEPSADLRARRAPGHGMSGTPMPHWDRPVQNPAGGMESTISDAIRWLRAQLDRVSTPLAGPIGETQRPRIASVPGAWVGLGWFLIRLADKSFIVWHSGRTGGFTSSIVFHPPSRTGVVALANSTSQRLDQETRAIAAALMKSEMTGELSS